MHLVLIYLLATLLFVLVVISLGFKPKFISRMNGVILLFVAIVGIGTYGYGYYSLYPSSLQSFMNFPAFFMAVISAWARGVLSVFLLLYPLPIIFSS